MAVSTVTITIFTVAVEMGMDGETHPDSVSYQTWVFSL